MAERHVSDGNRDPRDDAKEPARDRDGAARPTPPAGPHADPDLTNEDATPGTGSLPDQKKEVDPAGG